MGLGIVRGVEGKPLRREKSRMDCWEVKLINREMSWE